MKLKLLLLKLKNVFTEKVIDRVKSGGLLSKVESDFSQNIIVGIILIPITALFLSGNIILILLGIVLSLIFIFKPIEKKITREKLSLAKLAKRLGTYLSVVTTDFIDDKHEYIKLERTDLLNYTQGDYYSIRYLHIKNTSKVNTYYLPYQECSESKCSFKETEVVAYLMDKTALYVESVEQEDKLIFCHQFKIFFPAPLKPNEEIQIVYKIRLPNELKSLSKVDELMSIFLGRIEKKIKLLKFTICLNFNPSTTYTTCAKSDKNNELIEILNTNNDIKMVDIEKQNWYHKELNIDWGDALAKCFSIEIEKPQYDLYKLHYKRK